MTAAGDLGGGGDVPAGVRDVRGGVHLRRGQQAHLATGPIRGRRAHRHRHDLRYRPHLRRTHEPRRHALLRVLPAFSMDSGTTLLQLLALVFLLFPLRSFVLVLLLMQQLLAC
jgi:hypothetical protein